MAGHGPEEEKGES
jgi:WD40 repeat protein